MKQKQIKIELQQLFLKLPGNNFVSLFIEFDFCEMTLSGEFACFK